MENLHADDLIQYYEHHWQGAVLQVVTAIHLHIGKTTEGQNSASTYQGYTKGQLHQALTQTKEFSTAKEIAQEALQQLKIKQILKHQPRVYQTRKERISTK